MSEKYEKETKKGAMIMRNEFLEASSSSSPSPSPSSSPSLMEILRTSSHSSNLHLLRQKLLPGDSSSSRVSFRSSSEHSPSSSFSNGFCSSDDGSPFASPPFDEMAKHHHDAHVACQPDGLFHKAKKSIAAENLADDLGLCENLHWMNIRDDDEEDKGFTSLKGRSSHPHGFGSVPVTDHADFTGNSLYNLRKHELYNGFSDGGLGSGRFPCGISSGFGVDRPTLFGNSKGSSVIDHNLSNDSCSNTGFCNNQSNCGSDRGKNYGRNMFGMSVPLANTCIADASVHSQQLGWQNYTGTVSPRINDPFVHSELFGWDSNRGREFGYSLASQQLAQPGFSYNLGRVMDMPPPSCEGTVQMPNNGIRSLISAKGVEAFGCEDGLLLQGKSLNCDINSYPIPSMAHRRSAHKLLNCIGENDQRWADHGNSDMLPSLLNMSEVQGYLYSMAKDQHGCRFLQRIFDEGTAVDALIIFNEVIDHVVELMMDPFGNYLMQKLLDVCTEEQRTQIVLVVTSEPGQLIRISLNAYGTRVVQRLVETIRTRKQISLVKSALRPGFLDLIKDLNGNHVIQRCLQCLSTEDNKFIFDAATKFCIDIATHRHGCCVLQKCIAHSIGQQRDKLVAEISRNSLLLAQDPFGNYAVQFVIELRIPSAIATLLTQLKGQYVQLSMQKFSSHVVERCLNHCAESRPQIIRELISVPHFDQLLQDPFANFVIQAALVVTKGPLHASLVEAIRPHSILRNNPYCKRIFSRNLLKK